MIDLVALVNWLGPEGAIAGLEKSDLTISELLELAATRNIRQSSKVKRSDLIQDLVKSVGGRITKTPEELMEMDPESLKEYFHRVKASRSEILELLLALDIRPGSAARRNLSEFAAREISDIGMYKRVAKGGQRKD